MAQPRNHNDDRLWHFAKARMGRRRFLGLMAAGGAAAVLADCGVQETPEPTPTEIPAATVPSNGSRGSISKDPAAFIVHDEKSWEAKLENLQGLLTPNDLFFVRNNSVSLDLDSQSWRLSGSMQMPMAFGTHLRRCCGNQIPRDILHFEAFRQPGAESPGHRRLY